MELGGFYILYNLFKVAQPKPEKFSWYRATLYFSWLFISGNKMASVGRLQPFDNSTEDVESYIERVEAFFVANAIDEANKVATLITV
jgi:hypothetical protein